LIKLILILFFVLSIYQTKGFDRISFFGGYGNDVSIALAIDSTGNRVIAGNTLSFDLPVTENAYQKSLTPGESVKQDGFVAKYGIDSPLEFATYFGSSEEDYVVDVEIGPDNTIWIVGYTKYSVSFPYTNTAYDSIHSGGFDIFLANFSSDGATLLYSSIIGGSGDDFATSLAIAANGDIVVGGYTRGTDLAKYYPTTDDAIYSEPLSEIDGLVSVFARDGTLRYSSYLGGVKQDYIQDVGFLPDGDGAEKIALAYYTKSTDITIPANAYDPIYNNIGDGSVGDVLLQVIDLRSGDQLMATYFGGSRDDIPYSLAIRDKILIGGSTSSLDLPGTMNSADSTFNGNEVTESLNIDGFIAEFSLDLESLEYSSYIGGIGTDRIYSVGYDKTGLKLFCGHTSSTNAPVSGNAYQRNLSNKFPDILAGRISTSGRRLSYSTLLGDDGSDIGYEIESDLSNKQVIAGISNSTDLTLRGQLLQPSIGSRDTNDALIAEHIFPASSDQYFICEGDSIVIYADHSLAGNVTYNWFPKSDILGDQTEEPLVFPKITTVYTVIISDGITEISEEITVNVFDAILPVIEGLNQVYPDSTYIYSIQNIIDINPGNDPDYKILWEVNGGEVVGDDDLAEITITWRDLLSASLRVTILSPDGCSISSEIMNITRDPRKQLKIVPFGDYTLCEGDTIVFDGGAEYYDFLWNTGNRTRYDTIFKEGTYSFTARKVSNDGVYQSPQAFVDMLDKSAKPVIRKQGIYLRCLFAATSYQWYKDNVEFPGATDPLFEFPKDVTGCYHVEVTIENGCASISDTICIQEVSSVIHSNTRIYPNPANSYLIIEFQDNSFDNLSVLDMQGREQILPIDIVGQKAMIRTSFLAPAAYMLEADVSGEIKHYIFVVSR